MIKPKSSVIKSRNQWKDYKLKGLELCELYFLEVGAPLISKKFPAYKDKISGRAGQATAPSASDLMTSYLVTMIGDLLSVYG